MNIAHNIAYIFLYGRTIPNKSLFRQRFSSILRSAENQPVIFSGACFAYNLLFIHPALSSSVTHTTANDAGPFGWFRIKKLSCDGHELSVLNLYLQVWYSVPKMMFRLLYIIVVICAPTMPMILFWISRVNNYFQGY